MKITGEMLIGKRALTGTESILRATNPVLGTELDPPFGGGGVGEVEEACSLAKEAFLTYRETCFELRARFLETIASGILELGETLIVRAQAETGLPKSRLETERSRTIGQLKLFATVVRSGSWISATVDSPLPDRTPPRPDLRLRKTALGPVAVFGASNFPLAFSVAGGDTASAFAAGCPVVVKAHPAHLGTSELIGRVIQHAVATCGLHEGVFSLLIGKGKAIGEALVVHSAIKAVGFTGSRQGGLSLWRVARERPEPIPVYAEMSSINPIFVLPGALAACGEILAQKFVDSFTLGVGQFCTNPGLLIAVDGEDFRRFRRAASEYVSAKPAGTMLTADIQQAYCAAVQRLAKTQGVSTLAHGGPGSAGCNGQAVLFSTGAKQFLASPDLADEVFGPCSLFVACENVDEMRALAENLPGQLTVSLHLDKGDYDLARCLLPILESKAGRIVANSFPTGVEVSYAMVHGGPFPATSDSRTTSVGAMAIDRFLRPICYQDVPDGLLPESLQESNPLSLWRLRDGERVQR